MDMNVGTTFNDTAEHRDGAISFEHAASARNAKPSNAVATPVACGEGWYHDAAIAAAAQDVIDARANPYHH